MTAPDLIDVEVFSVLRRLERAGALTPEQAGMAVATLESAPIARVPHRALLRRAWAMRRSITSYDATYVALAEELGLPLVTCDARLARSHGHSAKIELYPVS
jgi:predicted nucleic acid-binding protein